jgi:hypothetical protein
MITCLYSTAMHLGSYFPPRKTCLCWPFLWSYCVNRPKTTFFLVNWFSSRVARTSLTMGTVFSSCLLRAPSCTDITHVLFICSAISSSAKCLRVSKTESYALGRICFEMTRQATMPSSSEKCLRVSKTESYGLSRICFEMTRQATMPSSKS